ncbi:MAG TPA: hypothetical protein VIN08_24315 [Ohtaekwangia sp.]|uniref:hypothetical protein n=1 Tax=Ohtaekwangia sp. TaxID=2066019 RepID=UPI002F92784E
MSDGLKFWIQTLVIPAVLAGVGYYINDTLQQQQRAFDKIKFTEQIINEAFDSDNPDKAMALTRIIPSLTEDKKFAEDLVAMVNSYYVKKAEQALKTGDEAAYKQISEAASVFKGDGISISDSLKTNPATSSAEKARQYEQDGLVHLQQGNLEKARDAFQKAEASYPGFHSSYEIANLLTKKIRDVKAGADQSVVRQQAIDTIQKKYSWRLSPQVLKKLNQ